MSGNFNDFDRQYSNHQNDGICPWISLNIHNYTYINFWHFFLKVEKLSWKKFTKKINRGKILVGVEKIRIKFLHLVKWYKIMDRNYTKFHFIQEDWINTTYSFSHSQLLLLFVEIYFKNWTQFYIIQNWFMQIS